MSILYKEHDFPDKLVAFLDILGFTKLVLQNETTSLQTINFIDGHVRHILKILQEEYGMKFSSKLFSDCMCVSCEYSNENIFYILHELAYIQLYFSLEGIFLRGALSRGNHFENARMIFSRGLVKAYELEQNAIYPRIIIDNELVDQIKHDQGSYFPIYVEFKKQDFLLKSPDGQFFIDYLNFLHEEGSDQIESLITHKQAILEKVEENRDDPNIVEKYRWLAEYHNFKFNEMFTPDDFEESYSVEVIKETSIDLGLTFPHFLKIPFNKT